MPDPVKKSGGVSISQVPLKTWDGMPNPPSKVTGDVFEEKGGYKGTRDAPGE